MSNPSPEPPARVATAAMGRWLRDLLGPFIGIVLVALVFVALDAQRESGRSLVSWVSVQTVLAQSVIVGTAALGMTLIIVAGGIDLSAGTAMALVATITAWLLQREFSLPVAFAGGVLTGAVAGAVNGTLISTLRVVPFIVTLGTMTIFQGVARVIAGDVPIRVYQRTPAWVPEMVAPLPAQGWMVFSPAVWIMFALAGLAAGILHLSVFGRHVFALGSNEATARLCGIPIHRTRILVYTLAGLFLGVAGLFRFAVLGGEGHPTGGMGLELKVIAAVVIGGGSLSGGRGSVLGTLAGAVLIELINYGCTRLGVSDLYQDIIVGAIIIAAVTLDQLRLRRVL